MDAQNPQDKLKALLADGRISLGSQLPPDAPAVRKRPIIPVEEAVPGVAMQFGGASCWFLRRSLRAIWPEAEQIVNHYRWSVFGPGQALDTQNVSQVLTGLITTDPRQVVYLDIESCGFAGTTVFLIGWGYYDGQGDFIVEQALARDYAEEAGVIAAVADKLRDAKIITTYNGKRFDMPTICERGIVHRTPVPVPPVHIDLLDHARRKWKKVFPNCKLQTLEMMLCRRCRKGDIPGSQIPTVYHDFVRTGDARKLTMVIHHNLLDVVTLAEVAAHIIAGTAYGD
ncbi:MAG: ribonuclease H-like domain-containing protein [Phycisphaerae bacterium]|nr:ribonuclease H-like domain-containing protein [Phycisphaerae bacterium]